MTIVATVLGPIGNLADHALIYAGHGLEIFPVNPHDKTPLTSQYKATTNTVQIVAWWQRWPTALIGHRLPDDQLVLDIDPKSGGDSTWRALKAAAGIGDVTTRAHLSGRGDGGGHTWWHMPGDEISVSRIDAWAQERGLGQAIRDREGRQVRWTGGIDLLHRFHRYTILPPSPHPETGRPYQWAPGRDLTTPVQPLPQFLVDLIVDDEPPAPPRPPREPDPDSIADWYTDTHTWAGLLDGWTLVGGDGETDGSRWRHPTATSKFSATVRHGCLFVYSPNTVFEVTAPKHPRGYTKFAAYAALEHQSNQTEAAKAARRAKNGPVEPYDDLSWVGTPAGTPTADTADAEEGGAAPEPHRLVLPDEFWTARPHLEHIRTAARSRMCAPDAMFAATICRVVQHIDYRLVLPPTVGSIGTLNLCAAIVAPSGAGKGAAASASAELIPHLDIIGYRVAEAPAGSGEGMVHAFYERVVEQDGKRKVTVMRRRYEGLLIRCDEGQALTAMAGRQGQTTMETLRSAFSGEGLGGSYSTGEKRVTLSPHDYRLVMLMAVQPVHARGLLDDWAGGTPQRFFFVGAVDPGAPPLDELPDWPGPLDWTPPSWDAGADTKYRGLIRGLVCVDDSIVREIREHHRAVNSGAVVVGRYDGHRNYLRLKVAAALAVLDGRLGVNVEDWWLAGMVLETSDRVRQSILATIADESVALEEGRNVVAARRAAAERRAVFDVDANVVRVARVIARRVHKVADEQGADTATALREVRHAVKAKDREWFSPAVAHAESEGWIVVEEGHVSAGGSRPA